MKTLLKSRIRPPVAFALVASLTVASALWAAQPISVYKEMQQNAGEALQIEMLSVKTRVDENKARKKTSYTARAKVVSVTRSKTGLKPGDTITIEYSRTVSKAKIPEPGPAPNPRISKGDKCPAFLVKNDKGKSYTIAAETFSFKKLD